MKRSVSLLLLPMAAMASASTLAQSVEDRARAAAEASRAKSSTSKAIQENYLTPGLSGQPIATVDRSQSFTPSLACQKTSSLLEILIQPDGTGDINTVRIARDTDLDGRCFSNEGVRAIADTGVDFISVGALTHSARAVDLGLDFA